MDKEILSQYIGACELIKETERDIQKLRQRRKVLLQDIVKGSMQEFPYAAQSYHIEGLAYATMQTPGLLVEEEELLEERRAVAENRSDKVLRGIDVGRGGRMKY